jgi:hypothetical protein
MLQRGNDVSIIILMKQTLHSLVVILFVLAVLTPTSVRASNGEGVFCSLFGWVVQPMGFCVSEAPTTIPIQIAVPSNSALPATVVESQKVPTPPTVPTSQKVATTTPAPTYTTVTNEYLTVQKNGVTEAILNERIAEVYAYVNALPYPTPVSTTRTPSNSTAEFATKDYVIKSLDKVYDKIGDLQGGDTSTFNGSLLTIGNESFADLTGSGLLNSSNSLTCATANSSTFGCLLAADWTLFSNKVASSSIDTSAKIAALLTDETGSGSMVFSTNPLFTGFRSNASSTIGDGTQRGGLTIWGGSTTTASAYFAGSVGIGTNAPTQTLSVNGTLSAGTTTARISDTGGQVCNVGAYGAVGDNSTDNYVAIMATIAACPKGGIIYFPMGEYRISQTIVLDEPVTLRGSFSPRWSYNSTQRSSIRAAFGTFVGESIIHVRDQSISGAVAGNNGGRIENLSIDGGSWGTDIHGVHFEGLVRDWKITDVDISQVSGDGFLSEVGVGSGNPRGFTIRGLSIYSAAGHGFRATALNDSYLEDVLTVGNAQRGFYLSSIGETKLNNSRAAFNALEGLYIDGSTNNGGMQITDFSTDRNDRHGVRISATGTTTITFNGLLTRRDGANNGGGSETPYAGVAIIGTSTEKVAPVFISNLSQITGVDDSGGGTVAPDTGVRVVNAKYVKVEGQIWGVTQSYIDGGGNDNFIIEENTIIKTGIADTASDYLFTDTSKWTATSTGLFYDGKISIGSTTGTSRLLNVTSATQPGARFTDTTNSVSLDMRADDFQAFIGTASNHELRLVTNGSSRLTINTSGFVGIGTTSPDQMLDVAGTIQSTALLGGATTLSTDANGNIIRTPSDERLKMNVHDIDNALEKVLALRGVSYEWKDSERFGTQTEIGFIAQEVDAVVPEVVRKGGEYWSLNTPNLLAVVVGAIQEIWNAIMGDRERITTLETKVIELETKLNATTQNTSIVTPQNSPAESGSMVTSTTTTSGTQTATTTATTTIDSAIVPEVTPQSDPLPLEESQTPTDPSSPPILPETI